MRNKPGVTSTIRTFRKPLWLAAALAVGAWSFLGSSAAADKGISLPPPLVDIATSATSAPETIVFAGGCFWGVQAVFQHTRGVLNAVSGYAGGRQETARYALIGSGTTGHAEAVQVTYDPAQISYGTLMQIYFSVAHDPTQLDRQGPDRGSQYRSAMFYRGAQQKEVAQRYIAQLDAAGAFPGKIVTRLDPLTAFYPAEAYHQDYATLHPDSPYIAAFDLPKIENLKRLMPDFYRDQPRLVSQTATTAVQ